eukprot:Hpha_TRINITY_DN26333_c0_g1::TRINITY_DN26333_c0_g1_i1::g.9314::m.9314
MPESRRRRHRVPDAGGSEDKVETVRMLEVCKGALETLVSECARQASELEGLREENSMLAPLREEIDSLRAEETRIRFEARRAEERSREATIKEGTLQRDMACVQLRIQEVQRARQERFAEAKRRRREHVRMMAEHKLEELAHELLTAAAEKNDAIEALRRMEGALATARNRVVERDDLREQLHRVRGEAVVAEQLMADDTNAAAAEAREAAEREKRLRAEVQAMGGEGVVGEEIPALRQELAAARARRTAAEDEGESLRETLAAARRRHSDARRQRGEAQAASAAVAGAIRPEDDAAKDAAEARAAAIGMERDSVLGEADAACARRDAAHRSVAERAEGVDRRRWELGQRLRDEGEEIERLREQAVLLQEKLVEMAQLKGRLRAELRDTRRYGSASGSSSAPPPPLPGAAHRSSTAPGSPPLGMLPPGAEGSWARQRGLESGRRGYHGF